MSWFDDSSLAVRQGDILAPECDALVCPVTVSLDSYGAIGRRLLEIGGRQLAEELAEIRAGLPSQRLSLGQAVTVTPAVESLGTVSRRLVLVAMWSKDNPYTRNHVYSVLINSIRQVLNNGIDSMALPILNVSTALFHSEVAQVLQDLDGLRGSDSFSLQRIVFMSTKQSDVELLAGFLGQHFPQLVKS